MRILQNSLNQSHILLKKCILPGDTVVDATAGNGYDTLFLSKLVGAKGKVFSFDIQKCAIENTFKLLTKENAVHNVCLINDGHENMKKYINNEVKAVIFNLGYLPKGDHNILTKPETTIPAVEQALELIQINGVIVLVIYHGQDSGFYEKDKLLDFVKDIDNKKFSVMKTEFINQINYPPILVCIERIM